MSLNILEFWYQIYCLIKMPSSENTFMIMLSCNDHFELLRSSLIWPRSWPIFMILKTINDHYIFEWCLEGLTIYVRSSDLVSRRILTIQIHRSRSFLTTNFLFRLLLLEMIFVRKNKCSILDLYLEFLTGIYIINTIIFWGI